MFRFNELSVQVVVGVALDGVDGTERLDLSCRLNVVVLVSTVLAVEGDYDNFSEVRNNSKKHSSFSLAFAHSVCELSFSAMEIVLSAHLLVAFHAEGFNNFNWYISSSYCISDRLPFILLWLLLG